jgi:uncharacterized protein
MRKIALLWAFLGAGASWAQTPLPSQILVSASGTARTPPDMVTIGFTLRGEGATSDEAAAKLRDGAASMSKGVAGLIGKTEDYHSSSFSIAQVRSKDCDASPYGQQRLSTGPCAVIGYIATMPVSVDTPRVGEAGTLTGLISRLGGVDVAIRRFWLSDEAPARRRAMQAALANAHDRAQMIATGGGARLGPLLRVQDADYSEISLEQTAAARAASLPPPPPPPPPPPVRIDLAPEPIQTTVRLMVAYGIGG